MNSQTKNLTLIIIIFFLSTVSAMRNSIWYGELNMWTDASIKSPHKARPYNGIGLIHSNNGERVLAIKYFSTAIELKPDFYVAINNLGAEVFREGNYTEALILFKDAISYEFNYPDAHNNLGSAYALLGDIDRATIEFQIAYKQNPYFVDTMLNLSRAHLLKGDKTSANTILDRVLAISPNHKEVRVLRSQL